MKDPHIEEEDYLINKGKNELYSFNLLTFKALLYLNEKLYVLTCQNTLLVTCTVNCSMIIDEHVT